MSMFITVSLLLACSGTEAIDDSGTGLYGGDGGASSIPCVEVATPLSDTPPPVTVDEVWPLIEAWSPTSITWSQASTGGEGESQPFDVTFVQAGDAVVVTRTGGDVYSPTHPLACRPGPELRIPISVDVTVNGGSATAHYDGNLDAQGASYPLIFFYLNTSVAEEPDLSAEWLAAAEAEVEGWAGAGVPIDALDSWFHRGEYDGDWLPQWGIGATAHTDDGGHSGVLWSGDLPAPE